MSLVSRQLPTPLARSILLGLGSARLKNVLPVRGLRLPKLQRLRKSIQPRPNFELNNVNKYRYSDFSLDNMILDMHKSQMVLNETAWKASRPSLLSLDFFTYAFQALGTMYKTKRAIFSLWNEYSFNTKSFLNEAQQLYINQLNQEGRKYNRNVICTENDPLTEREMLAAPLSTSTLFVDFKVKPKITHAVMKDISIPGIKEKAMVSQVATRFHARRFAPIIDSSGKQIVRRDEEIQDALFEVVHSSRRPMWRLVELKNANSPDNVTPDTKARSLSSDGNPKN